MHIQQTYFLRFLHETCCIFPRYSWWLILFVTVSQLVSSVYLALFRMQNVWLSTSCIMSATHRLYWRAVSTPLAMYLFASCSVFNAVSSTAACPSPSLHFLCTFIAVYIRMCVCVRAVVYTHTHTPGVCNEKGASSASFPPACYFADKLISVCLCVPHCPIHTHSYTHISPFIPVI